MLAARISQSDLRLILSGHDSVVRFATFSPDGMRADWTRPDPDITGYLQDFGRYGVPRNVVYGPGAPDGIALRELLTSDAVMDALRRATAGPARQQQVTE